MTARTALCCFLVLLLHASVSATKFHLDDEQEQRATEGNAAGRVIEGVILKDDGFFYTLRVVGGEIVLDKSIVRRKEEDGLTIAKIEKMEKARAAEIAAADVRRRQDQAADLAVQREAMAAARARRETEEKSLVISIDFQGLLSSYRFKSYDPVLHRANLTGLRCVVEDFLRREVQRAAHRHVRRRGVDVERVVEFEEELEEEDEEEKEQEATGLRGVVRR